ncbi:sodium-dependent bicarbonate transport family permease [Halomonas sp. MCCC 1A17488]|uniref:Sodium-dependent bicarbonate transport family permease n=1 Tax=Billgrantia sulfidoxydans TaxID=2733484 RepID=A0ABX7W578_9GAMM|nr:MULTISPECIES: sodium-dependent bicarbonate transport family permease [Halomonas]MCE8015485.1 sodium-dependent bicarbonate transport family permease [Halomonas sp. MCCC 1A17488]MCG3238818.1 sodium-dependent bicarbonate transport family permease [Halomonas sp. MCCC 1A17488]QPP51220.1 sodium-dependent bicarbonate transport family permease [Halomonas sp. SS10-MC5]QTP54777.1 sodium-dependent bicarbonate transport family permease [Halomonas sulfidoxydans]
MPDIVVMFFLLGLLAGVVKSDLTIPKAAYDTLSLLLMLTIGLKGGMALYGNLGWSIVPELLAVAALGALIPLALMPVLRRLVRLSAADSASIAAHYGSVSAGTFAVALAFAESRALPIGAEVTLYLVMMELPAIMVAIALYRRHSGKASSEALQGIWHETLTNRGVILLAGGAVIGAMYGPADGANVTDLLMGAFHAVLALFLLQMGLTAAETLRPIPWYHWRLLTFALVAPPLLSLVGMLAGLALGLPAGSVLILTALTASASYIAAPAAMRTAIPQANIGLAMLASLGFTFPLNVIVGIPLYYQLTLLLS